jgi:hypothetical protein
MFHWITGPLAEVPVKLVLTLFITPFGRHLPFSLGRKILGVHSSGEDVVFTVISAT